MSDVHALSAWKEGLGGSLTPCEPKDPDACRFDIRYRHPACNFASSYSFDTLYVAEQVNRMMMSAFEAGKRDAFAQLRQLIGVKP